MQLRRLSLTPLPLFALMASSSAKELEGVYQPTQNPCPSVEEAIAKMKVPDGYEVPGGRGRAYGRYDLVAPRELRCTTTWSY